MWARRAVHIYCGCGCGSTGVQLGEVKANASPTVCFVAAQHLAAVAVLVVFTLFLNAVAVNLFRTAAKLIFLVSSRDTQAIAAQVTSMLALLVGRAGNLVEMSLPDGILDGNQIWAAGHIGGHWQRRGGDGACGRGGWFTRHGAVDADSKVAAGAVATHLHVHAVGILAAKLALNAGYIARAAAVLFL